MRKLIKKNAYIMRIDSFNDILDLGAVRSHRHTRLNHLRPTTEVKQLLDISKNES